MKNAGETKDSSIYFNADETNAWEAKVLKNSLANPELPSDFVRDILIAREQQTEPFAFEE